MLLLPALFVGGGWRQRPNQIPQYQQHVAELTDVITLVPWSLAMKSSAMLLLLVKAHLLGKLVIESVEHGMEVTTVVLIITRDPSVF